MANVQISDMALAILPIDTANTFFELQTVEGGVQVSRKLSAQDLGIGGGVNSVSSGVNITVDNTDIQNPIINLDAAIFGMTVNGVVLNAAGVATNYLDESGNYSVPVGSGGQVDSVVGGSNISVDATDPVNPIVNLPAAITGMSVNSVVLDAGGVATNYLDETGNYSVPAGGGGGIGGSIADNQIAIGAAIANDIEGSADFTYDGSTFTLANATGMLVRDGAFIRLADPDDTAFATMQVDAADDLVFTFNAGVTLFRITNGVAVRIEDATFSDWMEQQHDGDDFNTSFVNTIDWNITGLTGAIQAGTIDVDFDAITATSFNGVALTTAGAATNYLDETGAYSVPPSSGADPAGTETISGDWTFTNVLGVTFDPSCELDLRNNADSSTTFIQNLGPTLQFGIAGADFGSGVFEIAQTSFVRLESPSIFIREQASAADISGEGQLYVRADAFSNTLMYVNDNGNEFEIGGLPYNGDLLNGAGLLADTNFVGWVNIGPKPNTDYTLICQGQITAPAIDDGKVQLTCDTNSIFSGLYTDSTGKVEAIRSAIGEVITNTIVVPTDGSASDDGTFFTIIGMFQAGATGQTCSLRAAKNADGGADGSIVRPSMSVVPLEEQ